MKNKATIQKEFYKKDETHKIYWVRFIIETIGADGKKSYEDVIGEPAVSFDKKDILYLFKDYPSRFSKEEKDLFDKENPYWAEFFKNRK